MKQVVFFVNSLSEGKIAKLIKEVNNVAYHIEIDFEKNFISL